MTSLRLALLVQPVIRNEIRVSECRHDSEETDIRHSVRNSRNDFSEHLTQDA